MFQAIGRLSSDDPKFIQTSCEIMNRVSTKGKDLQEMIKKFKNQDKDKRLDQPPINKGIQENTDGQRETQTKRQTCKINIMHFR